MFKRGKCPRCNQTSELIFSNNPLVPPICFNCLKHSGLDFKNLEHADFFCRTYNIPFNPNLWTKIYKNNPNNVIKIYLQQFLNENKENLYYKTTTKDLWKEANKEWEKALTHEELIAAIEPIKKSFIQRGRIKWGSDYTFIELMQLENLFTTTVENFDINNPMQLDAVKKACKLSVKIDKAIEEGEDAKIIKELSTTYNNFIKTAKIDELIESSQSEVIRTVADLVNYLEESGFEFKYYDNVNRDIVDKTIENIKDYLRTLVTESTGLEQTLETIKDSYEKAKENKIRANDIPLEELVTAARERLGKEIDDELEKQEIMNEDDDDDDYDEDDF